MAIQYGTSVMKSIKHQLAQSLELLPDRWQPSSTGNITNRAVHNSWNWSRTSLHEAPKIKEAADHRFLNKNCRLPKLTEENSQMPSSDQHNTNRTSPGVHYDSISKQMVQSKYQKPSPSAAMISTSNGRDEPPKLPNINLPMSIRLKPRMSREHPRESFYKKVSLAAAHNNSSQQDIVSRTYNSNSKLATTITNNNKIDNSTNNNSKRSSPPAAAKKTTTIAHSNNTNTNTISSNVQQHQHGLKTILESPKDIQNTTTTNQRNGGYVTPAQRQAGPTSKAYNRQHAPHNSMSTTNLKQSDKRAAAVKATNGGSQEAAQETKKLERLHQKFMDALPHVHIPKELFRKIEKAISFEKSLKKRTSTTTTDATTGAPSSELIAEIGDPDIRLCDLRDADNSFAYSSVRDYIEDNGLMPFSKWRSIVDWSRKVNNCTGSGYKYSENRVWFNMPQSSCEDYTDSPRKVTSDSESLASTSSVECLP